MKKSTIITVVAFALGVVVLAAGFILLTPNNISNKVFPTTAPTTTTTAPTPTTTTKPRPDDKPMDLWAEDISSYVTLGDYKGLNVEVEKIEISDEELDFEIGLVLAQNKEFTKNREEIAIADKMMFSFDFTGYLTNEDGTKGKAFEGGDGQDYLAYIDGDDFVIIYESQLGSFIDGFAQGIRGKKIGETFDIAITFPENYSEEMAGKQTIFEIKLNYVVDTNLSDGWVKEYTKGECTTVEEYKESVREDINSYFEEQNTVKIWNKIIENAVVEVPKQQFDYYYNNYHYDIEYYAAMYGMTYDQFLQNGGMPYFYGIDVYSDEDLVKYINDTIKSDLVFISIIRAENLEITDEEYRLLLDELIAETGKTEEKVLESYGGEEGIKNSMLLDEANKLVYKENTLVVKEK